MKLYREFIKHPVLLEYLTPEQETEWSKYKMTTKARKDTDHFFGKDNDHVREEMIEPTHFEKSETHKAVERHLNREIPVDHYRAGRLVDNKGQQRRIGAMIKHDQLRKEFSEDQTRGGSKKGPAPHYMTVVRGTGVAGQTNEVPTETHPEGHDWKNASCKNVEDGSNKHYLQHEITHGTVAVFGHNEKGKEIYRAALQPHHNDEGNTVYQVNSEYGMKHPAFTAHANDVAKRLSHSHFGGLTYEIEPNVYDDRGITSILHPSANSKDLDKALDMHNNVNAQAAAAGHENVESHHLFKALHSGLANVVEAALRNPKLQAEHIDHIFNRGDVFGSWQRSLALEHPTAVETRHIDSAMKHHSHQVRGSAVAHPRAEDRHLTAGINDEVSDVRWSVFRNKKVISKHIEAAIQRPNEPILHGLAVGHRNATSAQIDWGLNLDNPATVRQNAIRNSKATSKHIDRALDDDNYGVREGAASHKNASSANLHKALNDRDPNVNMLALSNPNTKPEHIDAAVNSPNSSLRSFAFRHKLITPEHIDIGMKDNDVNMRRAVISHKNVTHNQLIRALQDPSAVVRDAAIRHDKVNEGVLNVAVHNDDTNVRHFAALHPKANEDHVMHILKHDPEEWNRSQVIRWSPIINMEHIVQAKKDPSQMVRDVVHLYRTHPYGEK